MTRRELAGALAGLAALKAIPGRAEDSGPFLERAQTGTPHKGKTLLAIQAHSDDVALFAAGTVAKLIREGYRGYMLRMTNDDMGDDVGQPGTIGENVLRNEREVAEQARGLGLERNLDFNYNNHRMSDVPRNEVICRLIFLIRWLKIDTVFCYDPWQRDEENPDHYVMAHCVEAACWMAGRVHDYPEQIAAGFPARSVAEKYYYMRSPRHAVVNRVVDISGTLDEKIDANLCNVAKGPGGRHGSQFRAELAKKGLQIPALQGDERTADRNYIRDVVLAPNRELGRRHGFAYAEPFHYIGPPANAVDEYIKQHAVPMR